MLTKGVRVATKYDRPGGNLDGLTAIIDSSVNVF